MTQKEIKEKELKIIRHYGVIPQLKYFQSEVFELNQAIIYNRYDSEYMDCKENIDNIADEIADILMMIGQFKEYHKISDERIQEIIEYKIERQLNRMEME